MDNNSSGTQTIFTPQCLYPIFHGAIKNFLMDSDNLNYLKENIPLNECGLFNNNYSPDFDASNKIKNNSELGSADFANISFILGLFNLPITQENLSTCLLPIFINLDIFVKKNLEPNSGSRKWNKVPLNERRSLCINDNTESDMVSQCLVNNDSDSDAPNATNIKFIDQYRSEDMDSFYKACQKHRDQYRDPQGRQHPLDYFSQDKVAFQCPPDITSTYMKYPTYYTTYRHPIVLPRTLERSSGFIPLPERVLRGRYMKYSDFTYKR